METNHNYTVIIHRKWMDEEEYGRYTYEFDTYAEAIAQVQKSAQQIVNFLTAVNKHSAHIEMFAKHMNNDKPMMFLVLDSIDCSDAQPSGGQM